MSTISLSSGVRAALGSLSSVQSSAGQAQYRLSTGKKVNSAVDDPVNFFTAAGLNDRASQLTKNLDGISNGIQTITAASQGIDAINKLVSSLQSTIKQAQADAAANRPTQTGATSSTTATVSGKIGGGAVGTKSAKDVALDTKLGGTEALATASADGALGLAANVALTISAGNTTFTSTSLTGTSTVRDLVNEINKSGIATATIDDGGHLAVTGSGSDTLKVGLASSAVDSATAVAASLTATNDNAKIGLTAAFATTGVTATTNSAVRSNLVNQFNDLTKQIDQLAKDSGFNGKNLLTGDKLSIVFNEKTGSNQSKLDVQGSTVTSANLGILQAGSSDTTTSFDIQNDTSLSNAADTLTNVLTTLRSTSSSLGASLSTVQTRQDFTKNLSNTLTAGADNLVTADTNQEAANLLALQTRQQLSQTALSLSNQADQAILRLF
ncbi:flagellin-like hook-associated protein FlgL [Bosea sp. BE125]|uniref:flagellin N-terminal helical domain-containing protein n=1 Tax=Bosea sp. BE125 TaxID=2817909 RepID=UPI002862B5F3|nr:flagellin [Bosea sp. BE125]MDR6872858.1 flagellin-like hook-associated protein FlgL [Bosea sp. BE125]